MMNRRERLMATLRGEPVDRPPVSFYEINGLDEKADDPNPFNIYSHPSWAPAIALAAEETDRIVMRGVPFLDAPLDPLAELTTTETYWRDGSFYTHKSVRIGKHALTSTTRRDPDVNTVWEIEHLLKGPANLEALLLVPAPEPAGKPDTTRVLEAETALGDSGIVMIDTADPLCQAAALFDLGTFTVVATTEQRLFHRLLERFAGTLHYRTREVAAALPGRLWRIVGPEYASPPYLRPALFSEYVPLYDKPMVGAIQEQGGYARIHCHGRIKRILDDIVSTGCMGLDPIEPPPQGDVELRYVRERYGQQIVLFGNLEASDLETLPPAEWERKVRNALCEGTAGAGRGFVLMPSACPYGRALSPVALANYRAMVDIAKSGGW
jgi:hypothetical protein